MSNVTPKEHTARKWMRNQLRLNRNDYDDCGEINSTKLAENCANELNLCEGDEATIPEYVFDIAAELAFKEESK